MEELQHAEQQARRFIETWRQELQRAQRHYFGVGSNASNAAHGSETTPEEQHAEATPARLKVGA